MYEVPVSMAPRIEETVMYLHVAHDAVCSDFNAVSPETSSRPELAQHAQQEWPLSLALLTVAPECGIPKGKGWPRERKVGAFAVARAILWEQDITSREAGAGKKAVRYGKA